MEKLRVALADDHAAIRAGVRMMLEGCPDLEIVGEAADATGAVRLVASLRPDVLLIDVRMPGGGLKAIEPALEAHNDLRVLVYTMHSSVAFLRVALAAGAHGYIVKTAGPEELIRAIRTIGEGRVYADLATNDGLDQESRHPRTRGKGALSTRERQVLSELARGYTQRAIAERLGLSVRTVETYRTRITEKLGLHGRVDVVRYALETGLLGPGIDPDTSDGEGDLPEE